MENWSRSERSPQEWMSQTCQHVIRDLQQYGICVLDNFMGKERAESIHRSVVNMYNSGVFIEGKTVGLNNSADPELTKNVRNDHIAWVDGTENNCQDIAHLIATVDTIIVNSIQTMIENKRLEKRVIGGRTKVLSHIYFCLFDCLKPTRL
jgi:hypoxia-inducible factor (prolyl hydroxylase)